MNRFENLSENLKEIATLRLENPEASLVELGNMLKVPVGKSGVNHRLKVISQIADELRVELWKNRNLYTYSVCKRKCYYCDFISYCNEENNIQNYIECVKKEIKYKSEQLNEFSKKNSENFIIDTIYIGGGTPSFIEDKNITNLLGNINKYFNVDENAEITIELNPDSVNSEKLKNYQNAGINRVSIGLQSTNDKLLKKIGRIHNYEQFQTAYELVKKMDLKILI